MAPWLEYTRSKLNIADGPSRAMMQPLDPRMFDVEERCEKFHLVMGSMDSLCRAADIPSPDATALKV